MPASAAQKARQRGNRAEGRREAAQAAGSVPKHEDVPLSRRSLCEGVEQIAWDTHEPQAPLEWSLDEFVASLDWNKIQQAALRQEILNGQTDIFIGENTPRCMRHGCSGHRLKSALNGTLGLSHCRAGCITFDALWVTPWPACSDGYPSSLTKRGDYGEVMWRGGWPCRATIFVERW